MKGDTDTYIQQSKKLLFRTLNCCESQIVPFQNANDMTDDELLKAVTGLAGGLYNRGSTCGVVFGAAIDLAMKAQQEVTEWSPGVEFALLMQVSDYVSWFEQEFGGYLCRDRTELDFQTIKGKVGLLIPKKAKGCVKQSALSLKYLLEGNHELKESSCSRYKHCATDVMAGIRERTGMGNVDIERLVTVLDGGIGLSGGACGALAGAIISLGIQFGNKHSKEDAFRIRNMFRTLPRKFTKVTGKLINNFEEKFGSLECEGISGHRLSDFDDFIDQRNNCDDLVDWLIINTIELID